MERQAHHHGIVARRANAKRDSDDIVPYVNLGSIRGIKAHSLHHHRLDRHATLLHHLALGKFELASILREECADKLNFIRCWREFM